MKTRVAFISRHTPTLRQHELAEAKGMTLVPVGDRDGFAIDPDEFQDFFAVVVVHAAAAARLMEAGMPVGVFENANRAPEGERPTFEAVALHFFFPE